MYHIKILIRAVHCPPKLSSPITLLVAVFECARFPAYSPTLGNMTLVCQFDKQNRLSFDLYFPGHVKVVHLFHRFFCSLYVFCREGLVHVLVPNFCISTVLSLSFSLSLSPSLYPWGIGSSTPLPSLETKILGCLKPLHKMAWSLHRI